MYTPPVDQAQPEYIQIVFMRHGKSEHNGGSDGNYWYNSNPAHPEYRISNLTEEGKEIVGETADELLEQGINAENSIAFVSPMPRTQQTADILFQRGVIEYRITEAKLTEVQAGDF